MPPSLLLTGAVGLALLAAGCRAQPDRTAAAPNPLGVTPTATSASTTAAPRQTSPAPSSPTASPGPRPTSTPAVPAYDVRAVQARLTALRYYVSGLSSAVMAFQKVQGLAVDGSVGPATLAALRAPVLPRLRGSGPADRVEVDLTRQVLYVVKGGTISRVLPVSSGSGRSYRQKNGHTATALTPVGWYTISRRIVGVRKADLGTLYDPEYFYRGWAIHGSNSVPAYPASHGCIRVTRGDGSWLLGQIGVGSRVYIYGGTHTFTAGSSAAGTDNPTGDTPSDAPVATPTVAANPTAHPTAHPTAKPTPTPAPSPSPTGTPPITPPPSPSSTAQAVRRSRR